jgi:collagen beta-1,O-galactosyltransferase|tara:strand:+ start:2024 stop:3343 length:1320 start_codon:yes stop_codon:yes gene_type:complete
MSKLKFDKIYIITLDHTQKNYDLIADKLNDLGIGDSIDYEIVSGHDASKNLIPDGFSVYDNWQIPSTNEWYNKPVSDSEIGCTISHINCWRNILKDNLDSALILEDDFVGLRPISDLEEINVDYDLAYLGKWILPNKKDTNIPDHTDWVYSGASYNAHAYVITKSCALTLLDYNLHKNIIPLDEFLIATYTNHDRLDILDKFPKRNNNSTIAIATHEDYIGQSRKTTKMEQPTKTEPQFEVLDISNWEAWKEKYVNLTLAQGEYDLMLDDLGNNIYEFQLFTPKFCKEAVALAETLDKWTQDRHVFYPTNDVLLQDIQLQEIYHRVLKEIVYPLCVHVWQLEGERWLDMESENFMIRYTTERQSHLSLHHDFSDISMVVKLNDEFEGGGTWFPRYNTLSNPSKIGTASLHPGKVTHRHGARPISAGKRYIAVSFMRQRN